jgi:acetylornithine deacetylase/succinyl-diaminopimelate desuccinylase-like protein
LYAGTTIEIGSSRGSEGDEVIERFRFSRGFYLTLLAVLVIGGGTALALLRLARTPLGDLYIPKPETITPEIRMLQAYLRIDTTNPPGNEIAGARFLAAELAKAGVAAEIIESAPGRASVYARLSGSEPGDGLMLLSHIDVVPADPKRWTHPPFAGTIARNELWGRGALDMKSVGIAQLCAFIAAARSGRALRHDLVFLAVADEEQGGRLGMEWLLANRPDVIDGIRYAVNEGGITETVAGKITYFGIEVGASQVANLDVRGDRATLERLRIDLEPLFDPREPELVLPEVREYFAGIAPQRGEHAKFLADIDATIERGFFWILDPSYRRLVSTFLAAGRIRETEGGRAAMTLQVAMLPGTDPVARTGDLAARLERDYGVEVATTYRPERAPLSSTKTPFFQELSAVIARHYPGAPIGPLVMSSIVTDSRFLRARGIDAYGFWPYPVDYFQTQGIHGVDERLRLDWFQDGVVLMRGLVDGWAYGAAAGPTE